MSGCRVDQRKSDDGPWPSEELNCVHRPRRARTGPVSSFGPNGGAGSAGSGDRVLPVSAVSPPSGLAAGPSLEGLAKTWSCTYVIDGVCCGAVRLLDGVVAGAEGPARLMLSRGRGLGSGGDLVRAGPYERWNKVRVGVAPDDPALPTLRGAGRPSCEGERRPVARSAC